MRRFLGLALATIILNSCNGIFSGLYDKKPEATEPFGFVEVNTDGSGTIFIDTREYTNWVYVDLKNKRTATIDMTGVEPEPAHWDFAVHRYDVKTNGGMAAETSCSEPCQLTGDCVPEPDVFVADTASKVMVDLSGMMDGNIVYQESNINKVLSKWLNVDTSTMPPIYTLSRKVFLLRLDDGSMAALLFSDFMDDASVKGYVTIKYVYPLDC